MRVEMGGYWALEEAAIVRTTVLEAEDEAKRALTRLVYTRAECSEQHKAMFRERQLACQ